MTDQQYVVNSTGRLRRVLLCPPTYFEFQPINEITRKVLANGEEPDLDALRREHEEFADAYRSAGVEVELDRAGRDLPYMVYARDFGACLAEGVLIGSFRNRSARARSSTTSASSASSACRSSAGSTAAFFEGGDFWFLDEATIAHGVVARSTWEGVRSAARILEPLGYTVVGVQLPTRTCTSTWRSTSWRRAWPSAPPSSCRTSSCAC